MILCPGRLEFAAGRGPLIIDTAEDFAADFTNKGAAARRVLFGPLHGNTKIVYLDGHRPGNPAVVGFIGFGPVKGHAKQSTASPAIQTRIIWHAPPLS
jgi:hypothetical protein